MTEIVPAILAKTFDEVRGELARIRSVARAVQIDVVDGTFAPNATWPYKDGSQLSGFSFQDAAPDFDVEIDLMVAESEDAAEVWRQTDAARIIVHADAAEAREALMALQFESEEHKQPDGLVAGIALPCTASVDMLREYEHLYSFVQVMGIEKVGFQGQPFDPRALKLIRSIREKYPALPIQVDGGVSAANLPALIDAGASRLVVGSDIWKSEDPVKEIAKLRELVGSSM